MKRSQLIIFFMTMVLFTACAKKDIFYFEKVSPPHMIVNNVSQVSIASPPLFRPKGKRFTIQLDSQFFTMAIPNCIDMTGLAKEIRKSVADMLYTELFKTHRFNLFDRGELVNLDTDWIEKSLKDSSSKEKNADANKEVDNSMVDNSIVDQSIKVLEEKERRSKEITDKLKKSADGLLIVYITSRIRNKKGGSISLDYRIVSTGEHNVILFAGSQKVRINISSAKQLDYSRDDITKIAVNIVSVFPNPKATRKGQVISVDDNRIVIDIGTYQHIIPGLRGYVAVVDDSVYTSDAVKAQQYSYLAKFQITEVYDKTSTAIILDPKNADIKVGDIIVLK